MDAYSEDLRQRVVQACDEGILTRQEIADQFHVSTAWIRRLLQRRRETGSISALPGGRGPQRKLRDAQLGRLAQLVEKRPAATLAELRKSARLRCSLATIHRALKSLGLSFKKSRYEPASKTAKTSSAHAGLGPIA
jgi:transposase